MAIGYLTIQARTAHEAIPLEGVQVRVLDGRGNSLYQLLTDESGETGTVPLETLDKSFSQNQHYSGLPYASYNVLAQKAGFDTIYVSNIPIYDQETAVLPLAMIPMQERQRRPAETRIFVGKPAVVMQERRSQEGPADAEEDARGDRILRQVAIPNPITVHLGPPGTNAANVQVSFPDYVKNVASSEIYPTWPEAALTANIYAIITFALNRVYTEWYRSKGYNFDITNSTAYDQYFVYGRPIYESISRIVDNVFNEYARRQGQNVPYFTSFCNGTTVTCAGMSQWGTVTLANRGYTPLQILRSYYPKDIELVATDIITGSLTSYPGTPLRVGSTGLDVQTIQTYLNRIRRNYPAIPAITDPEGTFGESTRAAVAKFQSIFGLSPDGIVGKSTWYKISSLYSAVARLAELDSEGISLGIGTVPPNAILRQGSRGQDVITLQYLLDVASEYYASVPAPDQDGIFGSGTRESVMAFQRAMNIAADGIVGQVTWRKLYDVYHGIGENVPVPPPSPGPSYTEYTVRPGDSLWLIAQRYNTTVEAIKSLNGLTSDALDVGRVLRIPTTQTSPSYTEYTVRPGDSLWLIARRYGTTVEAIKSLNGLASDALDVGWVLRIPTAQSGDYGEYTVRAGDTLWVIARRFGTTVEAIKSLNGLTSDLLSIGQVLRIPGR
ncbi:MAG: LysM peptidoglycan-binding domain-containing protein [Lachnospiraceae bacterium]|nr:LysM peptidoglycan-binding domain-containing protein [uncultured Acetatifactor sp.]MCI9221433.1 LysM peptidoglycan-binding domain-containing protein [Lachnospiraceae bacterium]